MQKYTHIIWDWNGTLLDDVARCMAVINAMLEKRGLPALASVDAYRSVFGFPVRDYYRRVGFDFGKEAFETLAAEYIELYYGGDENGGGIGDGKGCGSGGIGYGKGRGSNGSSASDACGNGYGAGRGISCDIRLFPGAAEILAEFQRGGIRQVILSASETGKLLTQMRPFAIDSYFDEILGAQDIFAAGKADLGMAYVRRAMPERAVLVGDTVHDKEVADALGADCVLVASGHQGKATLLACNAAVADHLEGAKALLDGGV